MSRRKTHQEFLEELHLKNTNNIEVLGTYKTTDTKIKVLFKECGHVRYMTPKHLLRGQGCGHENCMSKKISHMKLSKKLDKRYGQFQDLGITLLSSFEGVKQNIKIKNNKCGHVYETNAGNVLGGSGCPVCHGIKDDELFKKEIKERYGDEYTILGKYTNGLTKIKTKHNPCGHIWHPTPKTLLRRRTCPKCNKSKGEHFVSEFLKSNNIDYKTQYIFTDCKHINPLPFDFAITIDGQLKLIEFDGSQHFGKSNYWGNKDRYNDIKRNDNIKNQYCKENQIPLLRIPYWWIRNDKAERELLKFII